MGFADPTSEFRSSCPAVRSSGARPAPPERLAKLEPSTGCLMVYSPGHPPLKPGELLGLHGSHGFALVWKVHASLHLKEGGQEAPSLQVTPGRLPTSDLSPARSRLERTGIRFQPVPADPVGQRGQCTWHSARGVSASELDS